jgi:hypothetical protein
MRARAGAAVRTLAVRCNRDFTVRFSILARGNRSAAADTAGGCQIDHDFYPLDAMVSGDFSAAQRESAA